MTWMGEMLGNCSGDCITTAAGMHCSSVGHQFNLTLAPKYVTRTFRAMFGALIVTRKR